MATYSLPGNDRQFQKLLQDLLGQSKFQTLETAALVKLQSEIAGEDNNKREVQLDRVGNVLEEIRDSVGGASLTNKRSVRRKSKQNQEKDGPLTWTEELKSLVAGTKSIGSGVSSFVKSPLQSLSSAAGGVYDYAKDVLSTPKDYKPGKEEELKLLRSKNPEADNIQTTDEMVADASKESVKISQQLLDTSKESLFVLKGILDSLRTGSSTNSEKPLAPVSTQEQQSSSSSILDQFGDPFSRGPKPTSAPAQGKKPTVGSRIMGGARVVGGGLVGAARFLGPIGAIAGAAYGGVQGYSRAGEVFGVDQEQATTGQKISSAVGGITDPFGLGYGDTVAKGVYGAGEKVSNFFGGIKDKVVGTADYAKDQYNRDLSGKLGVASSEAMVGTNKEFTESEIKTKEGVSQASNFSQGITSEKSLFGSTFLGGMFAKEGQTTGRFLSESDKSENFTGNAAAINLGSDLNVDSSINKGSSLLGKRISSGSMFKRDKYSVYDDRTGEELTMTKGEYNKIQALVKEGKTEEAQKVFNQISSSRAVAGSESLLTPEEQMVAPSTGSTNLASVLDKTTKENSAIRDEMATSKGSTQPIVSTNISSTSTSKFMPVKADPRPNSRGSALDNYMNKVVAY